MSKTITVTLNYPLIIEAVKAETYIGVETGKTADNTGATFNAIAGDSDTHKRKLERILKAALGSLETAMLDFVPSSEDNGIDDNLSSSATQEFTISIKVGDRLNKSVGVLLSTLFREYIINKMISLWWAAVPDRKNDVAQYMQLANECLANIRSCLLKRAPTTSTVKFEEVEGSITD